MKFRINIENITYFVNFNQFLEIDEEKAKYNGFKEIPTLNGFVLSFMGGRIKAMVFSSGKAFISGIKSDSEFDFAFWELIKKLKKVSSLEINPDIEIETENILASTNIKEYLNTNSELNLEKIAMETYCSYNPEKFPGVFIKISSDNEKFFLGTAIIFPSGKTLLGDIKNIGDAHLMLEKIIEKIK